MRKPSRNPLRRVVLAAVILFVLVGFGIDWWRRRAAAPAGGKPARITSDGGLSTDPAISRDGKWLAYASDRGGNGYLNLWIHPLAGGAPRRLTTDDADDLRPAFSPDGLTLAFRSERGEGGIYTVPVAGGEPRLLAPRGRAARFSPDGKWLAYWVSAPENRSELYLMPAGGGEPRRLAAAFRDARDLVWSPDGKHLLFFGHDGERPDWWTIAADGNAAPMRTGAFVIMEIQTFGGGVKPSEWASGFIYFVASQHLGNRSGNAAVWRIPVTPLLQITQGAERVTAAGEVHTRAAVAPDGSTVYSTVASSAAVWSVPLDAPAAPGSRLATADPARPQYSISADGRKLVYRAPDGMKVLDVAGGREDRLAASGPAVVSPTGKNIAYMDDHAFFIRGGEAKEQPCRGCQNPLSWSGDEKMLLHRAWRATSLGLFYTASGERREILRGHDFYFGDARFSPDNRWIAFDGSERRAPRQIYVVPFRENASPLRSDWIAIGDAKDLNRAPCWSADGGTLYFLSERDGFRCIWAQRLDSGKRPRGAAVPVRHFHQQRSTLSGPGEPSLALAAGKLVVTLYENRGELWRAP